MEYRQFIEDMSRDVYDSLVRAVELGKWPDGRALTDTQRQSALQAIIAWGELHLEEAERVGFIDNSHKSDDSGDTPREMPLSWKERGQG